MKYLIIVLSLFITACTLGPNAEPQEPSSYDEATYFYWPNTTNYKLLYEVVTEKNENLNLSWPQLANLDQDHPLSQALAQYPAEAKKVQQDLKDQLKEDPDFNISAPYDYSVQWLGGRYHQDLWSLALQVYTYTGGAHPNHWTDTHNYSPALNKIVLLEDLFTSDEALRPLEKSVFDGILVEKAKRWERWDNDETYDPTQDAFMDGLVFDVGTFNRWVTAERNNQAGILFFFAPYEIGPYSEGGYEVFIPATIFSQWLKEEFKAVFN